MRNTIISILEIFGKRTGLRHYKLSDHSGEEFYLNHLNQLFYNFIIQKEKESFTINLNGLRGISPSFIDEAFGNLVYDFTLKTVKKYVVIIATDKSISSKILVENQTYPEWEKRRKNRNTPIRTMPNARWYQYIDNQTIECHV